MTPPLRFAAPSLAILMATGILASAVSAQVELRSDARVLSGSAANCTRPATVDWVQLRAQTRQWKEIEDQNIREGSPRYRILHAEMVKTIKAAARAAASSGGYDLVVCSGDISDARGLPVTDLTNEVIQNL